MTGNESTSSSSFAGKWLLRINVAVLLLWVGMFGAIYFWDDLPTSLTNKIENFSPSGKPIEVLEEIGDLEIEEKLKPGVSWNKPWHSLSALHVTKILNAIEYEDVQIVTIQREPNSRSATAIGICNKRKGTNLIPINFEASFSWVNDRGWCYFPSGSEGGELVYYYEDLRSRMKSETTSADSQSENPATSNKRLGSDLSRIKKVIHIVGQEILEIKLNSSDPDQ